MKTLTIRLDGYLVTINYRVTVRTGNSDYPIISRCYLCTVDVWTILSHGFRQKVVDAVTDAMENGK